MQGNNLYNEKRTLYIDRKNEKNTTYIKGGKNKNKNKIILKNEGKKTKKCLTKHEKRDIIDKHSNERARKQRYLR